MKADFFAAFVKEFSSPSKTTYDITINLGASIVGFLMVIAVGLIWYRVRVKSREEEWIREHGVMLLVYFRNVDWRCAKLQKLLTGGLKLDTETVTAIRYELIKLQADLAALDRLTAMWGLRLDTIPIWYPYAVNFRLMLEAQAELQVALLRHIAPLVDLLDRTSIQEECAEELNRQLKAYVGYFEGGMDRLWAGGIRSQTPECAVAGSDILDAHRNKRLYERLSELFGSLTVLLKDNGAIPGEELRIWWTDENPEKVWYQQTLSQQDLR